jgi:hypothetical protein
MLIPYIIFKSSIRRFKPHCLYKLCALKIKGRVESQVCETMTVLPVWRGEPRWCKENGGRCHKQACGRRGETERMGVLSGSHSPARRSPGFWNFWNLVITGKDGENRDGGAEDLGTLGLLLV